MAKKAKDVNLNQELNEKSELFLENLNSDMHFKSDLFSNSMKFDWVDEIEFSCVYIDNIVRNPKVALIREEDVVKIEKAKKINVTSVKDLAKHTHFIEKIDPVTDEVSPSKILIERIEETFNTYENRFIYTLISNLSRFVMRKEETLDDLKIKNDKVLEYAATTITSEEKVQIELKISSDELPREGSDSSFEKEIDKIKKRVEKIKEFIGMWKHSELYTSLEKANVPYVISPIKKTNVILKNPNFQVASKLWDFLQSYDDANEENSKGNLDTTGNGLLKGILDDSFLMEYFVLDSISSSKREEKGKLSEYAIIMINQQIKRAISLLLNSGIKMSDQEILSMVANELKNERNKKVVNIADVKNKFKSEFDEYLEKIQEYL